ncbi:hypothetical protein NN561_013225 [Cricetulus griseus]
MEIGGRVLESPHPTNPFVARDQPCSRDASWSLPGPVAGEGLGPGVAGGRHGGERLPRGDAGAALEARCLVIVKVGEMCGGFGWPAALTRERQCQREWKPRASRICVASGVRSRSWSHWTAELLGPLKGSALLDAQFIDQANSGPEGVKVPSTAPRLFPQESRSLPVASRERTRKYQLSACLRCYPECSQPRSASRAVPGTPPCTGVCRHREDAAHLLTTRSRTRLETPWELPRAILCECEPLHAVLPHPRVPRHAPLPAWHACSPSCRLPVLGGGCRRRLLVLSSPAQQVTPARPASGTAPRSPRAVLSTSHWWGLQVWHPRSHLFQVGLLRRQKRRIGPPAQTETRRWESDDAS